MLIISSSVRQAPPPWLYWATQPISGNNYCFEKREMCGAPDLWLIPVRIFRMQILIMPYLIICILFALCVRISNIPPKYDLAFTDCGLISKLINYNDLTAEMKKTWNPGDLGTLFWCKPILYIPKDLNSSH